MTADAASPDTPTDPRNALWLKAYKAAKPGILDYQGASPYVIAGVVIDKLLDAGLLSLSGDSTQTADGEGSLRSRASGTPSETIAEALRGYRLNLGPNTVDSIKQGMTRLDLTGSERRDIGLIAAKALGLEGS